MEADNAKIDLRVKSPVGYRSRLLSLQEKPEGLLIHCSGRKEGRLGTPSEPVRNLALYGSHLLQDL